MMSFKYLSLSDFGSNDMLMKTITDFSALDKIDLSAINANSNLTGNQVFTFIAINAFSHHAGELNI